MPSRTSRILSIFILVLFGSPLVSRAQVPSDPNIVSLVDDTNSCSATGAVLCSTNGTMGYRGTQPFDLSTVESWFQVAGTTPLPGQTATQTMNAGDFLVTNDTGSTLRTFTLNINVNFDSSTPSVVPCNTVGAPMTSTLECDRFQPTANNATNPAAAGFTSVAVTGDCFNGAGTASAWCTPGTVTFTWSGGTGIPDTGTYQMDFSSWNTPGNGVTPEPGSMLLFGTGLLLIGGALRRRLA